MTDTTRKGAVDIVVPAYNYGRYLTGCVSSLLDQPADVRVLIIDDASSDDTPAIAARLAASDRRVEYRRHPVNRGHIATYNEGLLGWAAGEFCLLISADDMLTPGALGRAVQLLSAHPSVSFACGGQIVFEDDPAPAPDVRAPTDYRIQRGVDFIAHCCTIGHNPVATPTVVVRTSIQQRIGGYRSELPHSGDLEMWLRLAMEGDVGIIEAPQAYKRIHARNMQHAFVGVRDYEERAAAFASFFATAGTPLTEREHLSTRARTELGRQAFWSASSVFDSGNLTACDQLMGFARQAYPDIETQPEWARFRWKYRLGPALWSRLRPLVSFFRRAGRH